MRQDGEEEEPPRPARPRVGFHAGAFGGDHLLNALSALSRHGFEGVEAYGDVTHVFADRPDEFRTILEISGIRLAGIHAGGTLTDPAYHDAERAEWTRLLDWCATAGAAYVVYYGGERSGDEASDLSHAAALLDDLGARATERGLSLCYEPDARSPFATRASLLALLDRTSPRHVRLSLDTARMDEVGLDPVFFALTQHGRVGVVHLRDVEATTDPDAPWLDRYVDPGQGRLDLAGVVDALRTVGYRGWIVGVVDQPRESPRTSVANAAAFFRGPLGLQF